MSLATEEEEGGLVFLKNCGDELRAQAQVLVFTFYAPKWTTATEGRGALLRFL
jgi:hypothetical protein